jgi:hypothetical protein
MSTGLCGKPPDSVGRECYERRMKVHFVDFLCFVDEQVPADVERIYAILDNLDMPHSDDLLLFMLAHPRSRVRLSAQVCGVLEPD